MRWDKHNELDAGVALPRCGEGMEGWGSRKSYKKTALVVSTPTLLITFSFQLGKAQSARGREATGVASAAFSQRPWPRHPRSGISQSRPGCAFSSLALRWVAW